MSKFTRLQNVTLETFQKNGVPSYKILGASGEISSFTIFISTLERNKTPFHTLRLYARALAHFFDYLFEASCHIAVRERRDRLLKEDLIEIIDSWDDYLTRGIGSGNSLASSVARTLTRQVIQGRSSRVYHAPLKKFLKLSERIRRESAELSKWATVFGTHDPYPLYESVGQFLSVSGNQRMAMIRNSMLSGVLAGGPKELSTDIRPLGYVDEDEFDGRNLFPLESFEAFIQTFTTSRDKALYSLYAASGCRSSEGLQLLWEDIDFKKRSVALVNFHSRTNHPSYLSLTAGQYARLAWKGRTTKEAFLIEPFASMFWRHLEDYVNHEYIPHGAHHFVFQTLKRGYQGDPYFLTAASSRQEIFQRSKRITNLLETVTGPHSLRHAYATYLLNYCPNLNGGYGLPMPVVKLLLGHASVTSTERYAKNDKDILRANIEYANRAIYEGGSALTLNELKIRILLEEASRLGWPGQVEYMGLT